MKIVKILFLHGNTPMILSSGEGYLEIIRYLIEKGANIEANNHYIL